MFNYKKDIYRTQGDTGIEIELCYDASTSAAACLACGNLTFDPFDYMVVRFGYVQPGNGQDLDIFVYYDNTGTSQDKQGVGYAGSLKTPAGATDAAAYLWWATDDNLTPPGPCIEAVVIGVKNLVSNVVITPNIIDIPLRVGWFRAFGDGTSGRTIGDINVELVTYSGGTMSKVGTNIINTGGVLAGPPQSTIFNVKSGTGLVTIAASDLVGTIQYNQITKAATLVL